MNVWKDPRVRSAGIILAVGATAYWIDWESYRGAQEGLRIQKAREAEKMREQIAKNWFIELPDISHIPPSAYPVQIDWNKDTAFSEMGGQIYYTKGGRALYNWYWQYPDWHRYVTLGKMPSWKFFY